MKKVLSIAMAIFMASTAVFAGNNGGDETKLNVDGKNSTITWVGEKVTGSHTGNLNIQKGEISLKDGLISSARIIMDMRSITCNDLEDPEYNAKLIGHLKSPDFFSVEEHATAEFVLDKFTPNKGKDGMYTVEGTLTIKGISHPISFPAKVKIKDGEVMATADLSSDRSKYDIRYGSGSFFEGLGDNLIYDDVKVSFDLKATK
jgi:polyisoprenoid-binding protein YceI